MDVLHFCIAVIFMQGYASATCRFPGAPAHCSVTFSNESLSEGTYAVYECERGFELLGPSRRLCSKYGRWTPDGIPFCVLNVAAGKAPMQISTEVSGVPQRALDGSTADTFNAETCTLTKTESVPWWYVNLLEPYMVQLVRLDFGKPCCGTTNPPVIVVRVGNNRPDLGTNPICNRFIGFIEEGQPLFLPCNPPMPGAFVSVHLEASSASQLSICEAFVYTDQALPIERCPQFRDQPPGSTATYNGKCYIFYDRHPKSFNEALGFCRSRGGTLVNESNPALQGFISWELWRRHRSESSSQYWMGALRDSEDQSNWKWVNGNDVTVSFWNGADESQSCAKFDGSKGWLWADTDCMFRLNYICQHQPKTCGRPEQPPNSTMLIDKFGVGSSVEYTCDDGYLLVGSTVRTCLDTGFYDEFPPVCKRIDCGYPATIANGGYRLPNGTVTYLSHVQYMCKQGFEMAGRSRLICDIDERWNGPPPRCDEINCEPPPVITNGHASLIHNNVSFGSVVEYSCAPGYTLQGAESAKCLSSGLWDHPAPLCLIIETSTISNSRAPTSPSKPTTPKPTSLKPSSEPTTHRVLRFNSPRPMSTTRTVTTPSPILEISKQPPPKTFNVSTESPARLTTRGYLRPDRKHSVQDSQDTPTSHVPHIIVASYPRENPIFGSSNNNIHAEQTPQVNLPTVLDGDRREATGASLNIGTVIALAAFVALVFVIAIMTTIVILVRSKKHKDQTHPKQRHNRACTVDSTESSSSESRSGLTRYYEQNWEQLQEVAGEVGIGQNSKRDEFLKKDRLEMVINNKKPSVNRSMAGRRHHHHHHHRREPPHNTRHY